jgi:hypothetical protein
MPAVRDQPPQASQGGRSGKAGPDCVGAKVVSQNGFPDGAECQGCWESGDWDVEDKQTCRALAGKERAERSSLTDISCQWKFPIVYI